MKTVKLTLSLLALASVFACTKQEEIAFPEEGTVNKECQTVELVCADPSAEYQWKEDDQIQVFSMAATDTSFVFTCTERRDGKAIFTGEAIPSQTLVAIYPVDETNSVYRDGDQYSVSASIPSVQAAGLCNNAYVAIGKFAEEIVFKGVGTKVSITVSAAGAPSEISGVSFGSLSSESVTGSLKMRLYPDADPVILGSTSSNKSATFKKEVEVTAEEPASVSVYVIPQNLPGGYKVAADLADGTSSITKVEEAASINADGSTAISFQVLKVVFPDYFIEYEAPEALEKAAECVEDCLYKYDPETGKGRIYFDTDRTPTSLLLGNTQITSLHIPANIKTIGETSFKLCSNLEKITFEAGSTLTSLELQAFQNTGIVSVVFPASLTTTGQGSFNNNSKLESIGFEAGSKLATIGQNTFSGCTAVKNPIIIPASVKTIQQGGFNSKFATKIDIHFLSATPVNYTKNMFAPANVKAIYVPASALEAYKTKWNTADGKAAMALLKAEP